MGRNCNEEKNFIAAEYAKLPLIQPYLDPKNNLYLNGVNFASGGGGALAGSHQGQVPIKPNKLCSFFFESIECQFLQLFDFQAIGLQTQMKFFKRVKNSLTKRLGNARTQSFFSNSVFLFNFGGNDYLNPFDISYDIFKTLDAQEQFADMVIGNITIALKVKLLKI